jgi:hypothetical protein
VSDENFFFDDDAKPASKVSKTSKTPVKSKSSKTTTRPPSKKGTRKTQPPAPEGQSVSMTIAILFSVVSLLLGVIIGLYINSVTGGSLGAGGAVSSTTPPTANAPALSQDQMSGGVPSGHPDVNSMTGGTGGAAPGDTSASSTGQ